MKKARLSTIRHYIKAGDYFDVVAKTLDLIQREIEDPARKKRGIKLLIALRDDMRYLQESSDTIKLSVLRKKGVVKNPAQT
jgi:hypothetical protein